MQLRVRNKQEAFSTQKDEPFLQPQKQAEVTGSRYTHSIYIRCNAMLYQTISNMLTSAHTAQDFTYVSVADFIRAALSAYKDGMPLTELDERGEKINTTVRADEALKNFYSSLPDRLRSKLVERALRTFLKQ